MRTFYYKIVQHADEVTAKANDLEFKNKKVVKSTDANRKLKTALLKWFIQKRDSGSTYFNNDGLGESSDVQRNAKEVTKIMRAVFLTAVCRFYNFLTIKRLIKTIF